MKFESGSPNNIGDSVGVGEVKENDEPENEYDQEASGSEVESFRKEIEEKVRVKAEELGISKEELIDLAGLDLESLEVEKPKEGELKEPNLKRGELDFIRSDIGAAINEFNKENIDEAKKEFKKNKEKGEELNDEYLKDEKPLEDSKYEKFAEFFGKHKKTIILSELALYLSTYGATAFNFLVNSDFKVETGNGEVSFEDLVDNPELIEGINQNVDLPQEHFSEELASIYEEVGDLQDKDKQNKNLDESIEEADKFLDRAELIQNSEKGSIDDIVEDLKEKEIDTLLFGEYHGPDSNAANTVEVLEKMQDDDHKIAKIAFEFLSYTDPKAVELVEQFNNGEISAEDFYYSGCLYARSDIRPILEFAQDNGISITGIEAEEHFFSPDDLSRFTEISHRVGEIAEDKEEGEIVAVFVGARHITESNFNLDDTIISEYKEGRGEIDEKDYTIKEHLEESGFKPAAINLDDWEEFAKASDEYFRGSYNKLEGEDASLFGGHCLENWENYKLDQKDVFAVDHGEEENVYSIVSPGETIEVPPSLNALKSIEDNYPTLKEIMHKQGVFVVYDDDKISLEYNGEKVDIAQIDLETGQIKEIFLPEEARNNDEEKYEIVYSKELTVAYNKESEDDEKEHEYKNLETSIKLAEELFEYPEMIENSEKRSLDDFIENLSKKEFDNLIIGEHHGFGPTEQEAARIVEELIKNNRNVSAICLEGLSFEDPKDVEATKKFNEGKMSVDETFRFAGTRGSLLKTALDNSIEIIGVETMDKEAIKGAMVGSKDENYYDRFKLISEKIGEITEERKEDGIVVTYIGQGHVTTDSWEKENILTELKKDKPAYPQEEKALEGNYTVKEYLEKGEFNPVAFQMEDWGKITREADLSLAQRFGDLSEKDREEFYDFSIEKWKNYILKENKVFVTEYPNGEKNTFSVIIPSEIPEIPPILNGYKTIYDNPYLAKMLDHGKINIDYGKNIEFSAQINGERVLIMESNKTTGELIKMYLPEEAKDFQEGIKDSVLSREKLKEILTQYDSKQYERDHRIEGKEELRETEKDIETLREERTENVKKSLKKIRERISKTK